MRKPIIWLLLAIWISLSMAVAPAGLAESDVVSAGVFFDGDADFEEVSELPEQSRQYIDDDFEYEEETGLPEPDTQYFDDGLDFLEEDDLPLIGIQFGTEIVIGSQIPMNGQFGTEMWGNNSADMDVRAILHGYETVCMTMEGFAINETAVTGVRTAPQSDGSVVYTLQFADNLRYNDGTKITARDYAFYFLLAGAPEIEQIGGTTQGMKHIAGYEAYRAGDANVLSGVRVLSDSLMEVRITGVSLPYFYGIVLLNARPLPISEIAPGCEVADDGDGVYIDGPFTAALLQQTLLDPDTGYQYFPKVTSGAYALEAYDRTTNTATFVANANFEGNYEGQTPHIERIVFKQVREEEMLDDLVEGRIGLLNKVADGAAMSKVLNQANEHNKVALAAGKASDFVSIEQGSYLRAGFGFLAFACESSPTDSVNVRKAIAMGFDKDAFVADALPGFAMRTYGYYGLGQWMANYSDDGGDDGSEPLEVFQLLSDLDVPVDVEAANALLEADGWTLNENGGTYTDGDGTRYRDNDGALEPLVIRCAMSDNTQIATKLEAALGESLPQLGIELEVTEMPYTELLGHYYRQTAREYDMFFTASNFSYIFDPYYDFNTGEEYQGVVNTSGLQDEELMELARVMRNTEPQDLRGYVEKWLAFQDRFVDLMPMVPLYSNVYYDFYTHKLQNYNIDGISSWSYAIQYAYMLDTAA